MNIDKALQSVVEHIQSRDLQKAEDACREVLVEQPNNVDALLSLGVIYFQCGQYDRAIEHIRQVLQIDPNCADAYNNLGNIFQARGELDNAMACFGKTLQINPGAAETYYNLGICLHERGQFEEAIAFYQKALSLHMRTFGLLNNLGLALQEQGRLDEALLYLKEAIRMDANDAGAFTNIGTVLQKKGMLDEAVNCFQQAIRLDPAFAKAHYNLGLALKDRGQIDEAKTYFEQAIRLDPKDQSAYTGLSQVFQLEGQRFAPAEQSSLSKERSVNEIGFQVDNERKLFYVDIPKAGSTTIKYNCFFLPLFGPCDRKEVLLKIHQILGYKYTKSLKPYKDYFKFTVVRDPYTRFMSAYFHLIHKDYRDGTSLNTIRALGIEDWPDDIVNDPDAFLHHADKEMLNRDVHTALQTNLLPGDLKELDYIGQLERMEEVEQKLSQVLNIRLKFVSIKPGIKSQKKDYHSIKIDVDRFNKIFAEDYETLKDYYSALRK